MANALGPRLAEGATAEVYVWEPGWVVKLFRDWAPASWVEYEAGIARTVHASGLPVPAVGEIIEIQGRRGILYERIKGTSLLRTLMASPWKVSQIARTLADLHVDLHAQRGSPDLPSQHTRFQRGIQEAASLSRDVKKALLSLLDSLPEGKRICHHDFHPDNILMTAKGPVIIDWMNAGRGHPHADAVRTSLMLQIGQPPNAGPGVRWLLNIGRKQLRNAYLQHYCQRTQTEPSVLAKWEPLVAAVRLLENHDGEEKQLLRMIETGLSQSP